MLYYLGKTKKVGYPASPQANAKRFDIEAFAQMLRVFGCGCCRHPHFCRVMEVLYHRQIRSSAQ